MKHHAIIGIILASFVFAAFAGCASLDAPITAGPPSVASALIPKGSSEAEDLKAAARNLDSAVAIGVLKADDPAVACSHSVLKAAGLEGDQAPAPSFTPELAGPLSEGAVLYIRAQQIKGVQAPRVPLGCGDLLMQIRVDALRAGGRVGGLLR